MTIMIAHEAPVSIMPLIAKLTDYDYFLVHLFERVPEYKKYYFDVAGLRHRVIDNSIFELGVPYDPVEYERILRECTPEEYIIPDVLEDRAATIENAANWRLKDIRPDCGDAIGVVQGETYAEVRRCYEELLPHCRRVAFSFDYNFLIDPSDDVESARNRQKMITRLVQDGVIDRTRSHHLLGCFVPQEFRYYAEKGYNSFIHSLDTSNPIVHGMFGIRYTADGLKKKLAHVKLHEHIAAKPDSAQIDTIVYNVQMFRRMTRGEY